MFLIRIVLVFIFALGFGKAWAQEGAATVKKRAISQLVRQIDSLVQIQAHEEALSQTLVLFAKDETENSDSLRIFCQLHFSTLFLQRGRPDIASQYALFVINHFSTFTEAELLPFRIVLFLAWFKRAEALLALNKHSDARELILLMQKNCAWVEGKPVLNRYPNFDAIFLKVLD